MRPLIDFLNSSLFFWFLLLVLSLLVALIRLVGIIRPRLLEVRLTKQCVSVIAAVMLCCIGGYAVHLVEHRLPESERLVSSIAVLATTVGLCWLQFRDHFFWLNSRSKHTACNTLMILIASGTAAWSFHQVTTGFEPADDLAWFPLPQALEEIPHTVAVTDRGQVLQVYKVNLDEVEVETQQEALESYADRIATPKLKRSSPGFESNCHGWVFLGGEYLLVSSEIQSILDDNGYQLVLVPHENDIVIYRDDEGRVVHTGLIRGVLNDGTVIVESKWGSGACYLHEPWDQPYSQEFEYYHTARSNHRLRITNADDVKISHPTETPTGDSNG